ncbi:MAG: TetR/AcrR family transcriptional regulator [Bacteroidales bacterium]
MPKIEEAVDVRERILTESGTLFARYGIRSMTMDTLAEEMGISKRTIYENFKDKDTLLLEVINYYKAARTKEAHEIIDHADNAIEALFRIMRITVQDMKQTNPLFFHDLKKYHTSLMERFSGNPDLQDFSVTRNLLETGVKQKVFRKDIHIDIVNRTLHELFNLFNPDSSLTQADYHRKEMFENIIIPYFRGISTDQGRTLLEDCKNLLN